MGNKIKLVLVFPFIAREEERIKKKKSRLLHQAWSLTCLFGSWELVSAQKSQAGLRHIQRSGAGH